MVSQTNEREDRQNITCSYDEAVEFTGHGKYNYLLLTACSIITNAVALDMFGFSVVVTAAKCDLNLGLTETGVLASASFAGLLFAYPWGYYADTRGRRRALLFSTLIGFVFVAIGSLASSWQIMLFFKVVASSFTNASLTLTMTIVGECTGSSHRSKYLFIMNSFNMAGDLVHFGLAYLLLPLKFSYPIPFLGIDYRPWRLYTLIMALPLVIGGLMIACLHESPKFLASRGDNEKSLKVLRSIYEWNGGKKDGYPVQNLVTMESPVDQMTFWESVVKQAVPIFKPPLIWRTLQLFYLTAICCSTNNAFLMWYPTIVNLYFNSLAGEWNSEKKFCTRVFGENNTVTFLSHSDDINYICDDTISAFTIYSGLIYGIFFVSIALASSKFASRGKLVLIAWLVISAVSGTLVDLYQPVASLIFFVLVQTATIGVPTAYAYCVDLYATEYRGMMGSLSQMVARMFSLVGVNLVGAAIAINCALTFYAWSAFVFSGVVVAFFLPPDKKRIVNDCHNI